MATQQQGQQFHEQQAQGKRRKKLSQRTLVIATVVAIAVAVATIWILSSLRIIPGTWAAISSIVVTIFGAVFTIIQSLHLFFPPDTQAQPEASKHALAPPYITATLPPSPQVPPIIVQLSNTQPLPVQSLAPDKAAHRGIVGLPPPTDPRTIQQRESNVEEVYSKLTQPGITAIALTGIGGVGKSTLAALIYRYAEEQRLAQNALFLTEALWLTIDPAVTFADLAGNLFEALGKPMPDLSSLAPQNQAVALFNALNATEKARLVTLDQFENLLDWETGHALTDRPGVGEWLDVINSQQCACRILLTSRPRPVGTREYPPTYMQEYPVGGLEVGEGIELLRKRGVNGTEDELRAAVIRCDGHALALTLLASLVRDHSVSLSALFKDPALWVGDIATNLLDHIYTQRLSEVQRELLLAFSAYREPMPLDAAQAVITKAQKVQVSNALKALRTQRLLEAAGEGRYQLHAIIADYARSRFDEGNEEADGEALRTAHARAAQYYLQRAATTCPPREQRRGISDVHDLIEAIWQFCQAEQWQDAYDLMEKEGIFADLSRWGGYAVLQELHELLLPLDKWHPERSQEVRIYNDLGELYRVVGQNERALKYLEQGLRVSSEIGDRSGEGWALANLGRVNNPMGNKYRALEYYDQALKAFREVGDRRGEGMVLSNLGWVYYDLGLMDRASEYYDQALSIYQEVVDSRGEGSTLYSLGQVYRHLGLKEDALKFYERALGICKEGGNRGWEGVTLGGLGRLYDAMGQKVLAMKYSEEGLSIARETGDRGREGWAHYHLGRIYESLEDREYAQKHYEQALRILKGTKDRRGEAKILNHLGWVYNRPGSKQQATEYYRSSLSILREVGDRWTEGETLYYIGKFYFEQNHYDVALASFLLAKSILEEVQHPDRDETQRLIDKLHAKIGDEQFTALLAQVEPRAQQIVEQALREDRE